MNDESISLTSGARLSEYSHLFMSAVNESGLNILWLDEAFRILVFNENLAKIFYEAYGVRLRVGYSLPETFSLSSPSAGNIWNTRCQRAMVENNFVTEECYTLNSQFYCWELRFKRTSSSNTDKLISILWCDVNPKPNSIISNHQVFLDSIDNGICLIGKNSDLIDYNCRFYRLLLETFGIRVQRGKNFLPFLPRSSRKIWVQRILKGFEGESQKYEDELQLLGVQSIFQIKVIPVVENLVVNKLIISTLDITGEKLVQDQLEKKNAELLKINEELDRFVYSASHDLRAPLLSIKGLANMIKLDPNMDNKAKYTILIERSIERLDYFIGEIVQYSRNSHLEIISQEVDLNRLISDSLESLNFLANFSRIHIDVENKNLALFFSDADRLKVIFNNLISNAIQYLDPWKEKPFLKINILCDKAHAKIKFKDNGIGIASQHLPNIFKMFYRGHVDSKGSGLGLYIVKGVVEKLGGKINISSRLGEGTLVVLELPNLKSSL